MKFSGSFTAFVVASVATANLVAAAPIGQINSQSTSQSSTAPSIQTSETNQNNEQNAYSKIDYDSKVDIDYNQDNSIDNHPTNNYKTVDVVNKPVNVDTTINKPVAPAPVKVAKPASPGKPAHRGPEIHKSTKVGAGPFFASEEEHIKRQYGGLFGSQGASANGQGGNSHQGQENKPVVSGAGNSITTGGAQGAENNGIGGAITQSLQQALQKRGGFGYGAQGASADGFGGLSHQGQVNTPVVSGAGNSITAGGAQGASNNGQGGQIAQELIQQLTSRGLGSALGLNRAGGPGGFGAPAPAFGNGGGAPSFGFASGRQSAGANGFGGFSHQGQVNRPVLSGAGNSLTTGGNQGADNSGKGGNIEQQLLQKLGVHRRQNGAFGSQAAGANGQGGISSQFQSNRPVVSGFGNSVTTGGEQGSANNGQGGSISQSLEQLLSRGIQGQGQGVAQATNQFADSNARGGNAFVAGANGPVFLDGSAQGGVVSQGSGSKQTGAQSATQQFDSAHQNNFYGYRRGIQGQHQGIGQGTGQFGSAAATGGNAFVSGANGPVYLKTAAQGGAVSQDSASEQQGTQSGTQGATYNSQNNFAAYRPYFRRELLGTSQGSSQTTNQAASSDAKSGDVQLVNVDDHRPYWTWKHAPEYDFAPQVIDTSAKAGSVTQGSTSNQANQQKSSENGQESHSNNVKVQQRRQFLQGQQGSANAFGGNSFDVQHNGGLIEGNGKSYTSGGPQISNNSGVGGSLSQLISPQQ
ncbi:hypothetical protein ACQY0O_005162 [Thecaphora frezii]